MEPFIKLASLPQDPIYGLQEAFKKDTHTDKLNLAIGVLANEDGSIHGFRAIKKARELLSKQPMLLGYAPLGGDESFKSAVKELLFPKQVVGQEVYVHQAIGGTGALFHIFSLLQKAGLKHIYLTTSTWPNYVNLANSTQLKLKCFNHLSKNGSLDSETHRKRYEKLSSKEALLVQFSCHNPTGIDPNDIDWDVICSSTLKSGCTLILDMAYLGFSAPIEQELRLLHKLHTHKIPYFIALSFSKSLSLYGERVGAVVRVSYDKEDTKRIEDHLKHISRATHSSAPRFGPSLAQAVIQNSELRADWENELSSIRALLETIRRSLSDSLAGLLPHETVSQMKQGKGLFALLNLKHEEIVRLREQGIWCTDEGRVNIGSLYPHMIPRLVDAIRSVME